MCGPQRGMISGSTRFGPRSSMIVSWRPISKTPPVLARIDAHLGRRSGVSSIFAETSASFAAFSAICAKRPGAARRPVVHHLGRVEALDLARDPHGVPRRVEVRDRPDAALAGEQRPPERLGVVADRRDGADAR